MLYPAFPVANGVVPKFNERWRSEFPTEFPAKNFTACSHLLFMLFKQVSCGKTLTVVLHLQCSVLMGRIWTGAVVSIEFLFDYITLRAVILHMINPVNGKAQPGFILATNLTKTDMLVHTSILLTCTV